MLQFIKNKIKNKLMLNCSLLTGVILLAGFLCVYPMFKEGSLNRLLQTLFVEYAAEHQEFPAVIYQTGSIPTQEAGSLDEIRYVMDAYENSWCNYIDCPVVQTQRIMHVKTGSAKTTFSEKTRTISLGAIPDLYQYADVVYGVKPEDASDSDNEMVLNAVSKGAYPCAISLAVMDRYELVVGETISIKFRNFSDEDTVDLVITGIVEEKEQDEYFWFHRLDDGTDMVLLPLEYYNEILQNNVVESTEFEIAVLFDYTKINPTNAGLYADYLDQFSALNKETKNNFRGLLDSYELQKRSIKVILFTFELPIVALLLLFLYMISGRILEMETTEIAMLKSRGVSRIKIIGLYFMQSSIISFVGCVIGLPVGCFMCRLAAGTNAFLSFTVKEVSAYQPTFSMLLFAGFAFVLSVLFMTLPVVGLSKLTITARNSIRVPKKTRPFWEKYFLDIILMTLSGYLLYNYVGQMDVMGVQIMAGKALDPVIFLDSSLFIFSCGLLFLRMMGYLVRAIHHIGEKSWTPSAYIAFLQIIRSAQKQGFIAVFLVMTIAMGIFHTNLARSVNENLEKRTAYKIGTDLRLQERWKLTLVKTGTGETLWSYKEPDFSKYSFLTDYGIKQMTKVLIDYNVDIDVNKKTEKGNTLIAVHTREFGEVANLDGNQNDMHWYHYLNKLAQNPDGVIISSNLANKHSLKVGDKIYYSRYGPRDKTNPYTDTVAIICGIVDAFPGFESTVYVNGEDGSLLEKDNYLIVANYATVVNNCSLTPYEIWMKTEKKVDVNEIAKVIEDNNISLIDIEEKNDLIQSQRDSAMIQITNGMFSVGFLISLLVCAVGFLIYWVLTIKEREMLYGIYRAMGMSMKELIHMLVIEQIFSSLLAVLSGYGVGMITTFAFTRLLSIVYLPKKHNLPISIIFRTEDIIEMSILIGVTFVVCFLIMSRIVREMNITKALKMGED